MELILSVRAGEPAFGSLYWRELEVYTTRFVAPGGWCGGRVDDTSLNHAVARQAKCQVRSLWVDRRRPRKREHAQSTPSNNGSHKAFTSADVEEHPGSSTGNLAGNEVE